MGGLFINVNYIVVPIFLMFVDADKFLRNLTVSLGGKVDQCRQSEGEQEYDNTDRHAVAVGRVGVCLLVHVA